MRFRPIFTAVLFTLTIGLLSACDSSEERAEKHFQAALVLLEAGDQERAIVEFKNVFKLNGRHRDARARFAELQRQRGNITGAAGQYLRLVEQYPEDFEGLKAIAEIYAELGNWEQVEQFLNTARTIEPDDQGLLSLQFALDYRNSLVNKDADATKSAVENIRKLLSELPENQMLRQVVVDDHIRNSKYDAALAELDKAIELTPDDKQVYLIRLSVLAALEDAFGIEKQLKEMIVRFPDDETLRATLLRWYISQQQLDDAENFLRDLANGDAADTADQLTLVQFIAQFRGQDIALQEINRMVAAQDAGPLLLALQAGFIFDLGEHEDAIKQMRQLLVDLPESDEVRRIKIALAQMLETTGDTVAAQTLVDAVLAEDPDNVDAIKRKANWLIDADNTADAILLLRTAIQQAPEDATILTILARAHEREGNQDLVGEMLALALDASNGAPAESIRYADFLGSIGKNDVAEGILVAALRRAPGQVGILTELGRLYVAAEDWPRAEQVQATLSQLEAPQAVAASNDLKAQVLQGQKNVTEAVEFLEALVDQGAAGIGASVAIVRNHLATGDFAKAQDHVDALVATDPDNPSVHFLDASVQAAKGNFGLAEQKYRKLVDQDDQRIQVWLALFRLFSATDRPAEAAELIDEARIALPENQLLSWIKAGQLEKRGDPKGAIEIYEKMYLADSSNLVIANNLASLLSTASDDPGSLARAATISRRLRQSDVAPYQDTYGWISYLQGNYAEALRALEPAAKVMVAEPRVQYHLARAYLANNNPKAALEQFSKVVALTGAADTREFVRNSRLEFNRLTTELDNSGSE